MAAHLSTRTCRQRLASLWLVSSSVVFLVMVVQTFGDKYGGHAEVAWSWFLPTVVPTLSLIVGILVVDARRGQLKEQKVERYFFRVAFGLSAMYLCLVAAVLLGQQLTRYTPFELMKLSSLFLGPFQGITTAALGAFFVKGES